jgi:hypothetical protein
VENEEIEWGRFTYLKNHTHIRDNIFASPTLLKHNTSVHLNIPFLPRADLLQQARHAGSEVAEYML